MKTFLTLVALLSSLTLTQAQTKQGGQYLIDRAHSHLTWTGHAEIGSWAPTGAIELKDGTLTNNGSQVWSGRMVMDMGTLTHSDAKLQEHLRAEDFFDVTRHPTATFVLSSIGKTGVASGQLTIKGVTKPIEFPVLITSTATGLYITGTAAVDRTAYGIRYNSASFFSGLGDYAIANQFELTFDLVAVPVK